MAKAAKTQKHPFGDPQPGEIHLYRYQVESGRWLEQGQEFHVTDERGRFRFIRYVARGTTEWIDCWDRDSKYRSFRPDRVKRVHRKQVTRESAQAVQKEQAKSSRSEAARKAWETRRARESAA